MIKLSLESFILSPAHNDYVQYKGIRSYVRKSQRLIDYRRVRTLDRANTKNVRRPQNCSFNSGARRTGLYREFDELMRRMAVEHGFDGVFVENVVNEFLPFHLVSYGYIQLPDNDAAPCFWWSAN
jgi:hypothetical protein